MENIQTGLADGTYYMEGGVVFHELEEMPFDYWDESIWNFRHATGREYWDGSRWWVEYEEVEE